MMKNQIKLVASAFLFSLCSPVLADELPDLFTVKQEIKAYHDSGAYLNDVNQVATQAEQYLQDRVIQNQKSAHPEKLAVVFDIDETTLSNYQDMLKLDFGGSLNLIIQYIAKGDAPAISPTLQLYQLAQKEGVAVFFITGRNQTLRQATIKNLEAVGYHNWSGLSFRPDHYTEKSIVPFKSAERAKIVNAGYDIVLDIGDQQSDFAGGYTDKTFKFPNPYYFIS